MSAHMSKLVRIKSTCVVASRILYVERDQEVVGIAIEGENMLTFECQDEANASAAFLRFVEDLEKALAQ